MILFLLKCGLTIVTLLLDSLIGWICIIFALLLWEKKWMEIADYVFTKILWNKDVNINFQYKTK